MTDRNNREVRGIKRRAALKGHKGLITQIAWSPNGSLIASSSKDKTIRIWKESEDASNTTIINADANTIAWSPNSDFLIAGNDKGDVTAYELETGRNLGKVTPHEYPVYSLAYSPNGKFLASGSHDQLIGLWNFSKQDLTTLEPHYPGEILNLAWSPDSKYLASSSLDCHVIVWNPRTCKPFLKFDEQSGFIYDLVWTRDGRYILTGSSDNTIKVWDFEEGRLVRVLEGHTSAVLSITVSFDGLFLASRSLDGSHKIWRMDSWIPVLSFEVPSTDHTYWSSLAFHPSRLRLASLGKHDSIIETWDLDKEELLREPTTASSLRYMNVKLVLVGDSGVGKSALAFRIVENEFRLTESTHGARFWHMDLSSLLDKQERKLVDSHIEMTVWDLAGQPEYRLVHQLFLDDTDAALLLFDCSDPADPFRGIRYWARVLNKHAPQAIKYLVSSRVDVCPITVSAEDIQRFVKEYRLEAHQCTSAKNGLGVSELIDNVVKSIPWDSLPCTTTPLLFKVIRDCLLELKSKGIVLITVDDFTSSILERNPDVTVSTPELDTVINLMQSRGFVHRLAPAPTTTYVLLKPELLNSYSSSIIQAARNSRHGIGAISEHEVVFGKIPFSGFERLGYHEELILLQSAVGLLIAHDLCFREMGHLVFPSQIRIGRPLAPESRLTEVTYYFSGSIEIIYASLVVRLSYTDYFHLEDRWQYSAEFSRNNKRLGFVMEHLREDLSKLEIYFDALIDNFERVAFIRFITDHLKSKGLDVKEQIRVACNCGQEVSDKAAIEKRIDSGNLDIPCQYCGKSVMIPKSIEEHYRKNFDYVRLQHELSEIADQRTRKEIVSFNADREEYTKPSDDNRITVLHISDIHLGDLDDAIKYRFQIEADLKQELKINKLDFLVVSGDIADKATKEDYESAFSFIDGLAKRFGLDGNRVIVVPGNHDVNWDLSEEAYEFVPARRKPADLTEGTYFKAGDEGYLIRDDNKYKLRFGNFNQYLFKRVRAGIEYPMEYQKQCEVYPFEKEKILFLTLNTSWEADHHFVDRYSVNINSLINALDEINARYKEYLKLVVLHHPVSGPEMLKETAFLEQLSVAGFVLCLHGHVHYAEENIYKYDSLRRMHLVGAGTFGAPIRQMTPGIPLQYNLLRINPIESAIKVETRRKEKPDGAWSADARWGDKNRPEPFYFIDLRNG